MKGLALALSLFVASIGALGVIRPEALVAIARLFQTPTGLYVAAGVRIELAHGVPFHDRPNDNDASACHTRRDGVHCIPWKHGGSPRSLQQRMSPESLASPDATRAS